MRRQLNLDQVPDEGLNGDACTGSIDQNFWRWDQDWESNAQRGQERSTLTHGPSGFTLQPKGGRGQMRTPKGE